MPEKDRQRRKRNKISESQNHRCAYCGVKMTTERTEAQLKKNSLPMTFMTLDHVKPRLNKAKASPNTYDNLVAACYRCNKKKGKGDAYVFYYTKGWLR